MKNPHQIAVELAQKIEPGLEPTPRYAELVELIEAAINEQFREPALTDGKEIVFFIDEDDAGFGYLAHCRKTAHQWLDGFLDNLEDGEPGQDVSIKRCDMTQAEIEALPEI